MSGPKEETEEMESENGNYAKQVLAGINQLRLREDLIDLELTVENQRFPAHKVVFASLCPVFQKKISTRVERCSVNGVTADIFKMILDFAYTGNITLTADNVEFVWLAASRLQAAPLTKACETYFRKNINFENCLRAYSFGIDKKSAVIKKMAFNFIEKNFSAVAEQNCFLELSLERLIDIIKSDGLIVNGEEDVYKAVKRWIQHNEDRKRFLLQLLQEIRLATLATEFFQAHIYQDPDVMASPDCMRLVTDVLIHKLKPKPRTELQCFRPRVSTAYVEGIFIMGIRDDGSKIMAMMSMEKEKLFPVKFPPFCPKTIVASVCTKEAVYLMNCEYVVPEKKYTSRLWTLENNAADWRELEGPVAEKKYTGLVEVNGFLYAIGGGPGNVVERFDPRSNSWSHAAPLPLKVYFPTIVSSKGNIYVLGGTLGHSQTAKKSEPKKLSKIVQVFNAGINAWSQLTELPLPRKRLLASVFDNKIFIMDGCLKNPTPSNVVHCLDLISNEWVLGPPFNQAHSNPGIMTVLSGQLTMIDTTCLPELDIEIMAGSNSWHASKKRINDKFFKTVTRMFGGGMKVNSL